LLRRRSPRSEREPKSGAAIAGIAIALPDFRGRFTGKYQPHLEGAERSNPAMANVGYIGLGMMGSNMVRRLLEKGHIVTGYNRTRSKSEPLAALGMRVAESPRALAQSVDVLFSMVTNASALESLAHGPDGFLAGLGPGKILIDMTTGSPAKCRELAAKVREKGADMLDAPVSGSPVMVQQGKISIMVGGHQETFDRVRPLLGDLAVKVTHVGGVSLAVSMKIAMNLSVAVQMIAFSEGVLLAEKSGIARDTAVDVLTHSAIGSPMLQYRGPFVLDMPAEAWFDVEMMQKDLLLALEMGRQLEIPLPTTSVANEFMTASRAQGLAKKDFAAVFLALARMAAIEK
jgi:3-hydroxyisobutyrate dehydrogenase-like beta-hydroxyacid dehydrogenase